MDFDLFLADLEGRFDAERREQAEALVVELADAERADVTLAARMLAGAGRPLTVLLRGGERIAGTVLDVARTWVLVGAAAGESLIPVSAIAAVWPLAGSTVDEGSVANAVGIGHILRDLAERGIEVVVDHDAGVHQGTVSAVYADHLDLEARVDASGLDARDRGGSQMLTLPLSGIRRIRFVASPY